MNIRTAIRDWLNKPSKHELEKVALDKRLNAIECDLMSVKFQAEMLEGQTWGFGSARKQNSHPATPEPVARPSN